MTDKTKAETIARRLFPEEIPPEENCRAQVGREGLTCYICEEQTERWQERVAQVAAALEDS
jgi:hypothetical protein